LEWALIQEAKENRRRTGGKKVDGSSNALDELELEERDQDCNVTMTTATAEIVLL